MRQKGYNLVEIAIVLTVVLMISSLLATTYFRAEKDRRNEQAARQLETIKYAVVDYAAANKTTVRYVDAVNVVSVGASLSTVTVQWTLPAGRPYLPCPDINGDGEEDRVPAPIPATIQITTTEPVAPRVPGSPTVGIYLLEERGACVASRGLLPWKTLGTHATDPWGHYYTFRSAGLFTSPVAGFDQHTRANSVYKTRPITPSAGGGLETGQFNMETYIERPLTFRTQNAAMTVTTNINLRNYFSPALICAFNVCPHPEEISPGLTVRYYAGEAREGGGATVTVVNPNFAGFDGALAVALNDSAAYQVISGAPFVIVSHGENGYGGARGIPGETGYVCKPFPDEEDRFGEKQNALREYGIAESTGTFGCPIVEAASAGATGLEPGFVPGVNSGEGAVVRENPSPGFEEHDDIVVWMMMDELVAELTKRGALPASPWPPLGLER